MSEIKASLVKELREKTGAGMMECKKALSETNGDLDAAIDFLRKKGMSVAEKKAGRIANQGLVGVVVQGNEGAVLELNSETDFVAKNTDFQKFLGDVMTIAINKKGDIDAIKSADLNGKTVADTLTGLIATIGENMNLRRSGYVSVSNGVVVPYIHTATVPSMGKIGVLVALESTGDQTALQETGKKIAMHIAAANPRFLAVSDVDSTTIDHEKGIYAEQAKNSGKPAAIIEKMVEGRMRKFYEEVVLLEQAFIMDPDKKVKDIVADLAKTVGTDVKLTAFVRFGLGEGIEKKEEDFAAEVAKQMNG
ncbi:MAG: translation elongation factor Ts [Pseudomonadota bacterium]|nr:translation elongation factor Ts [Pseudomonadota bacterium]